ncbi:MAG: LamG domain protein jellyroll fold domain protein [Parcubacteria group bacterium]|nr:LamG domain protein jellyroll fold domain protein [Parcubacteria group bacterium]
MSTKPLRKMPGAVPLSMLIALVVACTGIAVQPDTAHAASSYYRTVTIDHTKAGSSNSTNFPILFNTTDASFMTVGNGGKVQNASGYDVRFYSNVGLTTPLAFEIDSYNGTTGQYAAWVKIPTLSASVDTVIYVGYGDASISTSQEDVANTWDSNFKGVWHFRDGATLSVANSIPGGIALTNSGGTASSSSMVGGGLALNGSTQYVGNDTTTAFGDLPYTLEVWVNPSVSNASGVLVGQNQNTGGARGAEINIRLNAVMRDHSVGSSATINLDDTNTFTANAWHYVSSVTSSATAYDIKLDNNAPTTGSTNVGSFSGMGNFEIGRRLAAGTGNNFAPKATYDEIRVSDSARSADWRTATYNSISSPGTFYALGSETASSVAASAKRVLRLFAGFKIRLLKGRIRIGQ